MPEAPAKSDFTRIYVLGLRGERKVIHWAIGGEGDITACGTPGDAVAVATPYDMEVLKITCTECALKLLNEMCDYEKK